MNCTEFRAIMRQHAGAVTLICAGWGGGRRGLTATAVCSVTDTPPTILVCVNKSAGAHEAIFTTGKFSVNVLSEAHREIAGIFAGQSALKGEERFEVEGYNWGVNASGTPKLYGALAHMDCSVVEKQSFSSHTIFFGQINEGGTNEGAAPLLYYNGQFGRWTSI